MSNTRSVLITGANKGIGLEFVRQYAADGWRVYAGCRNPERAYELNALAAGAQGKLSVHPLDVTNQRQVDAMAMLLSGQPLDVLINNAGVLGPVSQEFGRTDADAWAYVFQVNAIAPIKLIEAFADSLALSNTRVAAAISSKMASIADNGSGGYYIYRSSKAALNAGIKSAALDLSEKGVSVVALHPGWVRTDMGGPDAEIGAEQSVSAMRDILQGIGPGDSGHFIDLDRSIIPW